MRKLFLFTLASCLLIPVPASAGMIFKCRNADGKLFYQETPCKGTASPVGSWGSEGGGSIKLSQGFNGHYFVDASINEHAISFIIDTGATTVSIPHAHATAAGLKCMNQIRINTGNGSTTACTTRISMLRFGNFTFRNIDAVIITSLDQPLLGMNILKEFHIEQESGEMILSKR